MAAHISVRYRDSAGCPSNRLARAVVSFPAASPLRLAQLSSWQRVVYSCPESALGAVAPCVGVCLKTGRTFIWQPLAGQPCATNEVVRACHIFLQNVSGIAEHASRWLSECTWFAPAAIHCRIGLLDGVEFVTLLAKDGRLSGEGSPATMNPHLFSKSASLSASLGDGANTTVTLVIDGALKAIAEALVRNDNADEYPRDSFSTLKRILPEATSSDGKSGTSHDQVYPCHVIIDPEEINVTELRPSSPTPISRSVPRLPMLKSPHLVELMAQYYARYEPADLVPAFKVLNCRGVKRPAEEESSTEVKSLRQQQTRGPRRSAPKDQKGTRDPNRPKGYISAFNFYSKAVRTKVVAEYNGYLNSLGDSKAGQTIAINKIIGSMWRNASAEEVRLYENMAKEDKKRYLKEMEEYQPSQGLRRAIPRIKPLPAAEESPQKLYSITVGPRKPLSAYSIFARHESMCLRKLGDKTAQKYMSSLFRRRWQNMPEEELRCYYDLELAEKDRYLREVAAMDTREEQISQHLSSFAVSLEKDML